MIRQSPVINNTDAVKLDTQFLKDTTHCSDSNCFQETIIKLLKFLTKLIFHIYLCKWKTFIFSTVEKFLVKVKNFISMVPVWDDWCFLCILYKHTTFILSYLIDIQTTNKKQHLLHREHRVHANNIVECGVVQKTGTEGIDFFFSLLSI